MLSDKEIDEYRRKYQKGDTCREETLWDIMSQAKNYNALKALIDGLYLADPTSGLTETETIVNLHAQIEHIKETAKKIEENG